MIDTMGDFDTITLEKLRIGVQQILSKHLLDAQVEFDDNMICEHLAMRVYGFIWSEQHQHVEIKYPRDWWQAFKERWFLDWMLLRWPVEYETHIMDIKTLYPNYRPGVPGQEFQLRIFHQKRYDDI